ncbi:MAG: peptide deformylase [Lactobacillaceae bacterium]|nr:peptide deformylase [Lactobacillaceae bacterium]
MYMMKDIVRDPADVLRAQAEKVSFPLTEEDKLTMKNMMEYLVISQDDEENEKYGLRPGVGLAAPQIGISKQYSAVLIPNDETDELSDEEFDQLTDDELYIFKGMIINPVITRQSVKQGALSMGEGCLSVDEDVPGYVHRANRITVKYQDETGESHELKLEGYPAIVFQHEIDHLHGTLYYDHINQSEPWQTIERSNYIG